MQPGERPSIFGDALRRLTNQTKFMHADLGRYWYSMSASLNDIATDRAAQLEDALVAITVDRELTKYVNGAWLTEAISTPYRLRQHRQPRSRMRPAACRQ